MNFKKLKLYETLNKLGLCEIIKDEEGGYATLLLKGKWMIPILPILEGIHGLNKQKYERTGPVKDTYKGLRCSFGYHKEGMR